MVRINGVRKQLDQYDLFSPTIKTLTTTTNSTASFSSSSDTASGKERENEERSVHSDDDFGCGCEAGDVGERMSLVRGGNHGQTGKRRLEAGNESSRV